MTELQVARANKATEIAIKQLEAGIQFRQPRLNKIRQIEEMYAMKERPALVGRFNVPFDGVVMRGYVDTLMSKIDDETRLEFGETKGSAYKPAKKLTSAWVFESSPTRSDWPRHNRWGKKQMILTGRAYFKCYGRAKPFSFPIENVDHYDFVGEPNGGGHLEHHLFNYQLNIFRTRKELREGVADGRYDSAQVQKLITATQETDFKQNEDEHRNKQSRFAALGLDADNNNYVGDKLFNLTEGFLSFEGERYYIVFDRKSQLWIRFAPIKDVFESGLSPWVSYSSEDDAFNYLNLGPADVIYPVADAMYVNLNGMLNNARQRGTDALRAYDSGAITDPSQLVYRPDGLIAMALQGKDIRQAVMNLAPEDISTLSINIQQFMDSFLGQNTGITAGAKGVSDQDKVGIYFGDMQQVADRIGRLNKSYTAGLEEIGRRFDWALYEHADESYMVRIIGSKGAEWEKLTREDKDPDFEVRAISSRAEQDASMLKARKQYDALTLIGGNPTLVAKINAARMTEELLRGAEFTEDRIQALLDTTGDTTQEILSEAERLIEECLLGKPLRIYRGADTAFIQKILDFASNNALDEDKYYKLLALAEAHMEVAQENMIRKAMNQRNAPPLAGAPAPVPQTPPPASPMPETMNPAANV